MKILVVSDSHGNNEALDQLLLIYPKMDLYIHAGDYECDERSIEPFRAVKGNCDYFSNALDRLIIPIDKGTIIVQHRPNISSDILKENKARIFINGHTHVRRLENRDGLLIINPGAISFPCDGYDLSYAIIEINGDDIKVTFHQLSDNLKKI